LESEGYKCETAADGKEALWKAFIKDFDLVLMDVKMPGISGMEALPQMVNNHPDTCVIMLTAVADADTAVEAMKLGAYDYVTKPFDLDDLIMRVHKALERRRLILENKDYHLRLEQKVKQQAEQMQQYYQEAVQSLSREQQKLEEGASNRPQGAKAASEEEVATKPGEQSSSVKEFAKKLTQLFGKGVPAPSGEAESTAAVQTAAKSEAPQQAVASKRDSKQVIASCSGIVELEVKSPASLHQILQLHEHLRSISQVEALQVSGSVESDITISLRLSAPISLDSILWDLPEVECISDGNERAGSLLLTGQGEGTPVRRIVIELTRETPST
jgi:CheY-like chemotaxis protein